MDLVLLSLAWPPIEKKPRAWDLLFYYFRDKTFDNFIEYFILVVLLLGLILGFSFALSPRFFSPEKQTSYECGFEPFEDARMSFDVHFYAVGLLFLVFDLELIYVFPWIYSLPDVNFAEQSLIPHVWAILFFLGLLGAGFIYEWIHGLLHWGPRRLRY